MATFWIALVAIVLTLFQALAGGAAGKISSPRRRLKAHATLRFVCLEVEILALMQILRFYGGPEAIVTTGRLALFCLFIMLGWLAEMYISDDAVGDQVYNTNLRSIIVWLVVLLIGVVAAAIYTP